MLMCVFVIGSRLACDAFLGRLENLFELFAVWEILREEYNDSFKDAEEFSGKHYEMFSKVLRNNVLERVG